VTIPLESGERIDGEVVNESGEGVEGAVVLAWGDQRTPLARGISVQAGHFSLEGVPRSATAIEAIHSSQGVGQAELQRDGHDVVAIRLDPSTLVAGRLTLSDGEPVRNARLAFWDRREGLPSSYHSGAKADALGRFSLLCHPCENGEVEIAAMLLGSQFPISTWSVAVGERGLDLRIAPHRISLGSVALSTLAPASLEQEDTLAYFTLLPEGDDNRVVFPDVPPGKYTLYIGTEPVLGLQVGPGQNVDLGAVVPSPR